ncbi:plasmid recombination protein [Roseovarius sp. ZX-A-9]|uniref:plasmid recombination protein n=1 Tax=Roseovarius sp. ZX-A-9 TaxID=3014783 RepID=UPI002330170B|nr:plasmid recombination protein [Roseovarius sp. ZX-A-9]
MTELVFNIRTASRQDVRALSNHCQNRSALGKSQIDPARSHLNRRLHGGSGSVDEELAAWFKRTKSKKPAKQASTPYLTLVLGLSPSFYKADPANADRFNELAMQWLQEQFGDDLVLADLHLDETTPHIHAVVAPTYEKKKRLPGRRKKNETEEQFEARREAARNAPGDRAVGWSSSKYRYDDSFEDMRRSLVTKLAPLSVNYGTPGRRPREWKTWMNKLATGAREYGRRAVKALKVMKGALDNFDELHGQMSADRDAMRRMVKIIEKEINRSSLRSKEKEDIRKVIDVTKEELRMIDNNIKKAERFTEKVDNYVETNARGMRM